MVINGSTGVTFPDDTIQPTGVPSPGTAGNILVSNGTIWTSSAAIIPSGSVMLFYQAAAPTGWTQVTSLNDYALRIVSSTGGTTGGSVAFTTAFASQSVGATTLSSSQIPSHTHNLTAPVVWSTYSGGNPPTLFSGTTAAANSGTPGYWNQPDATGGGGSHTHSLNLAVQYANIIICSKN
jgi:hypothetical protein